MIGCPYVLIHKEIPHEAFQEVYAAGGADRGVRP